MFTKVLDKPCQKSPLLRVSLLAALLLMSVLLSSCVGKAFYLSNNTTILMANLDKNETDKTIVADSAEVLDGLGVGHITSIEVAPGDGCTYNGAPYYQRVKITDNKSRTYCMTFDRFGTLGMLRRGSWTGEVIYLNWEDKGAGSEVEDANKRVIFGAMKTLGVDDKQAARFAELLAETAQYPLNMNEKINIGMIVETSIEETFSEFYPNSKPSYQVTITNERSEVYIMSVTNWLMLEQVKKGDGSHIFSVIM